MRIAGTDAAATALKTTSDTQVRVNESVSFPVSQMKNTQNHIPQQGNGAEKSENPINEKAVSDAVDKMNKVLEGSNRRFEFSVHEKTHGIMVKVVDNITNEVIREFPPKKILDMVANMMELAGLIVDERR